MGRVIHTDSYLVHFTLTKNNGCLPVNPLGHLQAKVETG